MKTEQSLLHTKAREVYKHDIILKFANQTLKGVIEPEARKWFDIGSDMVDMIGGLPYRDELDYWARP